MIISHKHRFIFIKLRKTAGTSLEIALSGICGGDDIITPISLLDEKVRLEMGHKGAQNYDIPYKQYSFNDWANRIIKGKKRSFYNHMPASEIMGTVSSDIWKKYFKFCFERNPWDKTISHYYHLNRNQRFNSIMEYLKHHDSDVISDVDMYTEGDRLLVDKVFKFEEMEAALKEIPGMIGLESPLLLPKYKAKSQFRTSKKHYRELLSDEEAGIIAKKHAREIERMGYTY